MPPNPLTAPPAHDATLRGEPVARAVFTGLPARYDRLAYLLSFGQDRRWRRAVTDHAATVTPRLTLDVATGPAGVALAVAARTGADVVGVDLNEPMLRAGLPNVRREGRRGRVRLAAGRADQLPFADATFDAVTFSYLLRYVDDPAATIAEMARCLRPGGTMAVTVPRWFPELVNWALPIQERHFSEVAARRRLQARLLDSLTVKFDSTRWCDDIAPRHDLFRHGRPSVSKAVVCAETLKEHEDQHVRGDQDATSGVEREPVRLNTYGDLESVPLVTRRECRDCVLATIACEDEPARFRDERTCHSHEARYRFNVSIARAVDHVDGIIAGMCDVDPICGWMNIGVIEGAIGWMRRKFDMAQ